MLCAAVLPRLSPPRKRGAVSYGDVTSANVVGYQLIAVPSGFSLFAPTFKGVGQNLDLSTIDVCNADGSINTEIYGGVMIQLMNVKGGYTDMYAYDKDSYPENGWQGTDGKEISVGQVTFADGAAFCVNNDYGETVYIRISGEVDLINRNEVSTGFVLGGNATPVAFDLSKLNVVDADGNINTEIYGGVMIQLMNAKGGYTDMYAYDKDSYPNNGWQGPDGSEIKVGDLVLEPGQAVCINNDYGETVWMNPPCPIKK